MVLVTMMTRVGMMTRACLNDNKGGALERDFLTAQRKLRKLTNNEVVDYVVNQSSCWNLQRSGKIEPRCFEMPASRLRKSDAGLGHAHAGTRKAQKRMVHSIYTFAAHHKASIILPLLYTLPTAM
jgi:hypothetical protein